MNQSLIADAKRLIQISLEEDRIRWDITSRSCLSAKMRDEASIIVKEMACIAGLFMIPLVFSAIDSNVTFSVDVTERSICAPGTRLVTLRGPARSLLAGERVIINFLQHLTSIATKTWRFVNAVKGTSCKILDTRKTLPGLRSLQKYAVRAGGGKNHRSCLSSQFLIKDNHLDCLSKIDEEPIFNAIQRAKIAHPDKWIEIEVSDLEMYQKALSAKPDAILLDNMSIDEVREAVRLNHDKIYLEASGGISLDRVRKYALSGVNGLSIGELTHSIDAVDMSMNITNKEQKLCLQRQRS